MIKYWFMTTKMSRCTLIVFLFLSNFCSARPVNVNEKTAYPIHFLNKRLTEILINDNFSPVVASRVYAYTNLAAYTVLTESSHSENMLKAALIDFPHVQNADKLPKDISASLASSYAFFYVAKKMIYTIPPFEDSFKVLINWYKQKGYTDAMIADAQKVGKEYSDAFAAWMAKDNFSEVKLMPEYELDEDPSHWVPTYPSYMPALEPHWGQMRKLTANANKTDISKYKPYKYDTAQNSNFMREAIDVYNIVTSPGKDERAIADFWDCNAFAVYPNGHVMTVIKKISPGGHWIYIASIAAEKSGADLGKSELAYALTASAIYDAFIVTWQLKYQYRILRPETYLQNVRYPEFRPYLQSPPFPEYPSGHAVISMAAATMLTYLYGSPFSFRDNTEDYLGLPARTFNSFSEAATEAGISRYYGGIHYKYSCTDGSELGALIGNKILEGVKNKK